jgi:hypothetical protein
VTSPEVISVAVRSCPRPGLSYQDMEELLTGRGTTVDHVTACQAPAIPPLAGDDCRDVWISTGNRKRQIALTVAEVTRCYR